jgi:hypothetical protein
MGLKCFNHLSWVQWPQRQLLLLSQRPLEALSVSGADYCQQDCFICKVIRECGYDRIKFVGYLLLQHDPVELGDLTLHWYQKIEKRYKQVESKVQDREARR